MVHTIWMKAGCCQGLVFFHIVSGTVSCTKLSATATWKQFINLINPHCLCIHVSTNEGDEYLIKINGIPAIPWGFSPPAELKNRGLAPLKLPFHTHARVGPLMSLISLPSPRLAATSDIVWVKNSNITLGSKYPHRQAIKSNNGDAAFISVYFSCWCSLSSCPVCSTLSGTFCQRTCSNSSEE